jgi:hypothetical protein
MINETNIVYTLRVFWVDKAAKKVKIISETKLEPGEMTSLPDQADIELTEKLKVCIRPSFSQKWSDEFKLLALKEKLQAGSNVVWGHHRTYSILRKEATERPGVFNFILKPPMIVLNCLPCRISVKVT